LLFSAVWNYGVTAMTTWRRARWSVAQRAARRAQATPLPESEDAEAPLPLPAVDTHR